MKKQKQKQNKTQQQQQQQQQTIKTNEHVAPCWKTGCQDPTGKTAAVLCNVPLSVGL